MCRVLFMTDSVDLQSLRDQVRSDRHAGSYPLVVIGAVGFHYASLLGGWIPPAYGLPLAFVLIWALQWRHERRTGVGPGHDEVLAIAFAVFLMTSLTASQAWQALVPWQSDEYFVLWLLGPTAAGLTAIGVRQRGRSLVLWGVGIASMCAIGDVARGSALQPPWSDRAVGYQMILPQVAFLAATVVGLLQFRTETVSAGER